MQCILTKLPPRSGHTATSSIRIRPQSRTLRIWSQHDPKGKAYGEPNVPIREKDRPRLLQSGSDLRNRVAGSLVDLRADELIPLMPVRTGSSQAPG